VPATFLAPDSIFTVRYKMLSPVRMSVRHVAQLNRSKTVEIE